ncbi:hypothetical protein N7454_000453 [Penicillium verhagenii]|nr:hypothetical protein N7454_000453 [Penicillium verhagenii]
MTTINPYDDVAWVISTDIWKRWPILLFDSNFYNDIGVALRDEFPDLTCRLFASLNTGGFNISFKMDFTNNYSAIIRFPIPGSIMFPEEKVRNEVSIIQFLLDKASHQVSIPVPSIVRWETTNNSPSKLGRLAPFIIMDYIPHKQSMGDLLSAPIYQGGESPVLNPDLKPDRLEALYEKLAKLVLSLSTLSWNWTLPRSELPTTIYDKASSYFEALAGLHISHLKSQRNEADMQEDITEDALADTFRRKFVARFLFRKLIRDQEHRKQVIFAENGPFPVWCDDFRPENVLVDEAENIAGVVDWEFTYTAPTEFSHAPPWWLLLRLDDWCAEYEKPLQSFLEAMRKCEDKEIRMEKLKESQRLSDHMRDSWESGNFWVVYAARNNFAFDAIYWEKIDQRFLRNPSDEYDIQDVWQKRLPLLEAEEIELMEQYVDLRVKEWIQRKRDLTWQPGEYTVEWIKRMVVIDKIQKMKKEMEEAVMKWKEEIKRMKEMKECCTEVIKDTMEMQRKGEIKTMEELGRIEVEWTEMIKDMKELERKDEILDMIAMKEKVGQMEMEWTEMVKDMMEMEGRKAVARGAGGN